MDSQATIGVSLFAAKLRARRAKHSGAHRRSSASEGQALSTEPQNGALGEQTKPRSSAAGNNAREWGGTVGVALFAAAQKARHQRVRRSSAVDGQGLGMTPMAELPPRPPDADDSTPQARSSIVNVRAIARKPKRSVSADYDTAADMAPIGASMAHEGLSVDVHLAGHKAKRTSFDDSPLNSFGSPETRKHGGRASPLNANMNASGAVMNVNVQGWKAKRSMSSASDYR